MVKKNFEALFEILQQNTTRWITQQINYVTYMGEIDKQLQNYNYSQEEYYNELKFRIRRQQGQ